MPAAPARQPGHERVAVGRHRLVGQEALDVFGQILGRGVALLRKPGRSETDRIDAAVAATLAVEAAADSRAHDKPPGKAIFM